MATKRKGISKKTRFEVFKRDSFTCQYCGKKAPDVLLELEHIKPVSKGGSNNIINLTTACTDCNAGKSDRELTDNSVIEKQRKQLELLQERREQLDMMMQWHEGLHDHHLYEVEKVVAYFNKVLGIDITLTDTGKAEAKRLLKKYGFPIVLKAVDVLPEKYSHLSVGEQFDKLSGILHYLTASEDQKQAMYIKGIIRNRFCELSGYELGLIKEALELFHYDYIASLAKNARTFYQWKSQMEDLLCKPTVE